MGFRAGFVPTSSWLLWSEPVDENSVFWSKTNSLAEQTKEHSRPCHISLSHYFKKLNLFLNFVFPRTLKNYLTYLKCREKEISHPLGHFPNAFMTQAGSAWNQEPGTQICNRRRRDLSTWCHRCPPGSAIAAVDLLAGTETWTQALRCGCP